MVKIENDLAILLLGMCPREKLKYDHRNFIVALSWQPKIKINPII